MTPIIDDRERSYRTEPPHQKHPHRNFDFLILKF
nr:MAG TPA: hypothetical protein [Caudoviricetes sp.]